MGVARPGLEWPLLPVWHGTFADAAKVCSPPILPLLSRCSFRLPQIVEPVRSHPRVVRCVPGVTVSEVVLNDSQIMPLVRQGETAGMA